MIVNVIWEGGDQCPGCRAGWHLFPPVRVDESYIDHADRIKFRPSSGMFRCVECKRVYKFEPKEMSDGRQ